MALGVDFGGTAIKIAEVDAGTIVRSAEIRTPVGAPAAEILIAIADLVRAMSARPDAVGMAIPGEVDEHGRCYRLPNVPGFEDVAIAEELGQLLGARVFVENDGTVAALGELLHGHGRRHPSFLMMTLGTGIGGGLVVGGHVVRGAHGFGAEIGHIPIDASPQAAPCVCGSTGCVEAYAGTHAVLAAFERLGGSAREIRDVAESARRGERAGLGALEQMATALGIVLTSIQNLLDLDAIVFTGGIANAFDLLHAGIRAELRKRRFAEPLGEIPLLVSELGAAAGVVGAASLATTEGRARMG